MNKKSVKTINNTNIQRNKNGKFSTKAILALLLVGLLIGSVAYILADISNLGPGSNGLEIDGFICADKSPANLVDWGQCTNSQTGKGIFGFNAAATGTPLNLPPGGVFGDTFFFNDGLKSGDPTMFSGSNKNDDPITGASGLHWLSFSNSLQKKDDLSHVYTYFADASTTSGNVTIGDRLIYIGLERIADTGDSHIDMVLFQQKVGLVQTPPCTLPNPYCTFSGARTTGDVLISMDFVVGGGLGSFTIRTWNTSSSAVNLWNPTPLITVSRSTGVVLCNASKTVCAQNNAVPILTGPWGTFDSSYNFRNSTAGTGATITGTNELSCTTAANTFCIPVNGFTEMGLDLTKVLPTTPCVATIMPETRSSQSFDSTLQDFAAPHSTGSCTGAITIQPDKTNEVGTPHTFTVNVTKNINGVITPAVGVKPTVTLTPSNGISASNITIISNNCATTGTNSSGQCTITFVSNTAGKVTGSATATFQVGNLVVTVSTDGVAPNSGPAVKTYVDAFITVSPLRATNEVNTTHTFTFTVKQNTGNGLGYVAVSGANVSWTLTPSNGATPSPTGPGFCITNGAGQCTVTFTSTTAGTVTVHGSVTLNVGGVSLTRATGDGISFDSPNAVKVFVDAFITVSPLQATNEVNTTHTFTFTVCENLGTGSLGTCGGHLGYDAVSGANVSWTLTPSNGATPSPTGPGFCITNGAGQCTVTFTSTTAGTVTVHGSTSIVISGVTLNRATGDGISFDSPNAVKVFVDAFITVSPLTAQNSVGQTHTVTFTVCENLGTGSLGTCGGQLGYDAVSGATVSYTLIPTGATPSIPLTGTCSSLTDANGQCTISFTSPTPGTVIIRGSISLLVSGVTINRITGDSTSFDSPNAIKIFIAGSISWIKEDNVGNLLGGATFKLCTTDTFNGTCTSFILVLDNGPFDANPNDGLFNVTGLAVGNYTIQEFTAPPGFSLPSPNPIVPVMVTGGSPNVSITEPFTNPRPILKLSGFGYTNTETSTPSQCTTVCFINGTVTYSITIHNFGSSAGFLNMTFIVGKTGGGSFACTGSTGWTSANLATCTFTATNVFVSAGGDVTFTVTATYTNVPSNNPAIITATLDPATYNTAPGDTFIRNVNGAPATISFTVQAN